LPECAEAPFHRRIAIDAGPCGLRSISTTQRQETIMQLIKTAKILTLGTLLGVAALSTPAFAGDNFDTPTFVSYVKKMSNKDGMMTKKDFLELASMQFDKMDTDRKGMLSEADVMKLFGRTATK
jgi:hypothetical protein